MLREYLKSHRTYSAISRDMRKKQKTRVASDPLRRLRVKVVLVEANFFQVLLSCYQTQLSERLSYVASI